MLSWNSLTVWFATLLLAVTTHGTTIYVNGTCGNDAWSGAAPACVALTGPKATIQTGIKAATDGDIVSVAPGTYHEIIDLLGKAITLHSEQGAATTIIDGQGLDGAVVRIATGEGPATVVAGFTVRHGTGEPDGAYRTGGGMYIVSSPTIRQCVIRDNHVDRGGGMFVAGFASITDCQFVNNSAKQTGGGLDKVGSVGMLIEGCTFSNNTSNGHAGGALFSGAVIVRQCSFIGNQANTGGGCALSHGIPALEHCTFVANAAGARGGGCWIGPTAAVSVSQCEFTANQSLEGGGFFATSGPSWVGSGSLAITECLFAANLATIGGAGAIDMFDAVTLVACEFTNNAAPIRGGALHFLRSSPALQNCTFESNTTDADFGEGGGLYLRDDSEPEVTGCVFEANEAGIGGAVMSFLNSSPTFAACTFNDNAARFGGAVAGFVGGTATFQDSNLIENTAELEAGAVWLWQSAASFSDSTLEANWANNGGGIFARESALSLNGTTLHANTAYLYGGGIYGLDASTLALANCHFESNNAISQSGGGVLWSGCNAADPPISVTNCDFVNNIGAGPAMSLGSTCIANVGECTVVGNNNTTGASGGAISGGSVEFSRTSFSANSGNAAYAFGGVYSFDNCQINDQVGGSGQLLVRSSTISNSEFSGSGQIVVQSSAFHNAAVITVGDDGEALVEGCDFDGGGAYSFGGLLRIINCEITGADEGIYVDGRAIVTNCRIDDCKWGVRIWEAEETVTITNTIIHDCAIGLVHRNHFGESVRLANCTIADCFVAVNDSDHQSPARLRLANCILTSPVQSFFPHVPHIDYSNIVNGKWTGPGIGNISADPLFVNAAAGDYHLQPNSPCIDAGNNWGVNPDLLDLDQDGDLREFTPLDFDLLPRFVQAQASPSGCGIPAVVDIGAFEHQVGAAGTPILGDATGDSVVSIDDFIDVILSWGSCSGCCLADFDINGSVDVDDLITVLLNWG